MEKDRLGAFSDGVIAVIITIMVLELKEPDATTLASLRTDAPVFASYVLSFIYVGIYWNNHHHFFHLVRRVNGAVLWANLHLLFWLSLIPFATSWVGNHPAAAVPTAAYGVSLLMPAVAWQVMQRVLVRGPADEGGALARAIGRDLKGRISPVLYLAAVGLAFVSVWVADAIYVGVAWLWLVPDRRVERVAAEEE
jgi:uncharacterized membrane protein